ncbi:MAG: hypothetical protein LBL41_04405 [Bifidobacteriaceae bacterium]|jgi:hypothetical protein|nr:hypothetical protein [Bifidobacteriaceae bacterium]
MADNETLSDIEESLSEMAEKSQEETIQMFEDAHEHLVSYIDGIKVE